MKKPLILVAAAMCFFGCESAQKALSFQPQIWKSEGYAVSVTRPGMATSTDTSRVADAYCGQFNRVSLLTKLASPLIVPMRDEFICQEEENK